MTRPDLEQRQAPQTQQQPQGRHCLVLSLSGQEIGVFGRFAGDRFSVETPTGRTLWLSGAAIYLENPLYIELICMADGLHRYVVDPPLRNRRSEAP